MKDVVKRLEKLIAIYFNGDNYVFEGYEFTREESKIFMYSLLQSLQFAEMLLIKEQSKSTQY